MKKKTVVSPKYVHNSLATKFSRLEKTSEKMDFDDATENFMDKLGEIKNATANT